jgi:hypothetical protein
VKNLFACAFSVPFLSSGYCGKRMRCLARSRADGNIAIAPKVRQVTNLGH